MSFPRKRAAAALASVTLVAAPAVAQDVAGGVRGNEGNGAAGGAVEKAFELWIAHGESDNLAETSSGTRGTFDSTGLVFDIVRNAPRLELGMATDLEFRMYSEETLEDETLGTLDLLARVVVVPTKFNWMFQDNYGQRLSDPFLPESPTNREAFNVFSTGPELRFPFGGRTQLGVSSVYSDRKFEETVSFDSRSLTHELGLFRQKNRTTLVALVGRHSDIEYDEVLPGYGVDSVLLQYVKTLSTGEFRAEAGSNELSAGDFSTSGPLYRIAWNRAVTPRSRIAVSANREFTDAGTLLTLGVGRVNAERVQDVLLSADPMELERVGFDYAWVAPRSQFSVGVSALREDYEIDSTFDNDAHDVQLSFRRQLTPRLQLAADAGQLRRDFGVSNLETVDKIYALRLDRQLGAKFLLGVRVETAERSGQDAFERTLWEVRFTYRPAARGMNAVL